MARINIDEALLDNYVAAAPTRQAQLTDLAATTKTAAADTIKQLQDLGIGGAPTVDPRAALAKLTSGQTLTDAEKNVLNIAPTVTPTPVKPLTATEKAAKQTADAQAAADKPTLTEDQIKQGYTVQWVRTGAAGAGEWRIIRPGSATFGTGNKGSGNTGASGSGATGDTGGKTEVTLVSTKTNPDTGEVVGYFSDGTQKTLTAGGMSTAYKDAYALLQDTFRNYGLSELTPVIEGYMKAGLGSEQAALQLKQTDVYKTRFRGNELRLAAGQNALTEAEYLNLENSYVNTLQAYGLAGYFGTDRKAAIAAMSDIIGKDVSATEFADRVNLAVTEVKNSDPAIKAQLQAYYGIDDVGLVSYYLNPKQDLESLKKKTLATEIGAAASAQGLKVGSGQNVEDQRTAAEALAGQGITQQQAIQGYKTVADVTPTGQKLSGIYNEAGLKYGQQEAEAETFGTTGAASAQRKRKQLQALEEASFGGKAGVNLDQVASLNRGVIGKF